ncbi:hypothetical protein [Arthrobacter nitrophenolicus]|uniref:O-antigen ligase domain-containing protein n=1 Tax=Arthrobacter nitrophenolicus TaxID=683150 RepID=A0A4R5XZI4_9MICC|nr:hypothetical protein [Arthrobacter nitrophenolicus]TDL37399.1 hypothetical protein E2R57_11760 [Arthrobacter nitrophenolicus]
MSQFAPMHLVSAVNLLLAPLTAALASRQGSVKESRFLLKFAVLLTSANAVACVWQLRTGVDGLVAAGLSYGSTVRQIDGVLRTPGLTLSSATAGLFAGAVLLCLLAGFRVPYIRLGNLWTTTGVAAGSVVLISSTSRSGVILVVIMALGVTTLFAGHRRMQLADKQKQGIFKRALIIVGMFALPFALAQYGASSTDSLFERFLVWQRLLDGNLTAFGMGAGSVGASSYSAYNPRGGVFVDNSWLSFLMQYGLVGLLLALATLTAVLRRLHRRSVLDGVKTGQAIACSATLLALSVTALFVEIFDYVVVMTLLGSLMSQILAETNHEGPAVSSGQAELRNLRI